MSAVVGCVVALLAAAAPVAAPSAASSAAASAAAGSPPGTVDTWSITGCDIRLTNGLAPASRRVSAHWHTAGTVTCTGTALDAEVRIDLMRNRVSLPNSFARASCSLTAGKPCAAVDVTHDTAYRSPRADWQPRLVLFIRGPLSVVANELSDQCVVDIPSFETICTFVGRAIRR